MSGDVKVPISASSFMQQLLMSKKIVTRVTETEIMASAASCDESEESPNGVVLCPPIPRPSGSTIVLQTGLVISNPRTMEMSSKKPKIEIRLLPHEELAAQTAPPTPPASCQHADSPSTPPHECVVVPCPSPTPAPTIEGKGVLFAPPTPPRKLPEPCELGPMFPGVSEEDLRRLDAEIQACTQGIEASIATAPQQVTCIAPCAAKVSALRGPFCVEQKVFADTCFNAIANRVPCLLGQSNTFGLQFSSPLLVAAEAIAHAAVAQMCEQFAHVPLVSYTTTNESLNFGHGAADRTWVNVAEPCIAEMKKKHVRFQTFAKPGLSLSEVTRFLDGYPPVATPCRRAPDRPDCVMHACLVRNYDICTAREQYPAEEWCVCRTVPFCQACYAAVTAAKLAENFMQDVYPSCCIKCEQCKKLYCVYSVRTYPPPTLGRGGEIVQSCTSPRPRRPREQSHPPPAAKRR